MEDTSCPLCTEDLDPTDLLLASRLCQCRFAVCLWCFRRLTEDAAKDSRPALCPGCRQPYDTERIAREGRELDPEQLEEVKRKKGRADARKGANSSTRPRKDLANVRVVQRNLVYVVGLPMECCFEEILASQDYIGQFGKIVKISVSRTGPYGTTQAKNGPTGGAYVTFKRPEDARKCIESIHGTEWQGKLVKACYGTTKYCNSFLKGQACNNLDCLYLHDVAMDEDSYTKEETKSTKFVNLVHAASLNPAPSGLSSAHGGGNSLAELNSAFSGYDQSNDGNTSAMEEDLSDTQGWPNLSNSAWSKQPSKVLSSQSISLTDDPQAWPGLPGGADLMSGQGTPNLSSAETSETEGEGLHSRRTSLSRGATMAVKLAQSSTGRDVSKEKEPPRKLMPLPGRHRQQSSLDSGLPSVAEAKEVTGLSPPPTPQLLVNRAAQKPMSPELEDREPLQQPEGSESTSQTTVYLKPDEVDSVSQNSGYQKGEGSSLSADTLSQKAGSLHAESLDVLPKPPPGFSSVPLRPKMGVPPPPGFADLPSVSGFAVPAYSDHGQSYGTMPAFAQGTDGYGYGGESRHVSLGGSSQRSQSRFSFAQGHDSPTSKTSRQPPWSDSSDEVFGGSNQWQFSQIFGGAFGVNGASLYNTAPIQTSSGYKPLQADWRDSDDLPAGLALLKRLQAQGGIPRQDGPNPSKVQQSFFADAAITPATPQISAPPVVPEVQKTPGRRRKSKAVAL